MAYDYDKQPTNDPAFAKDQGETNKGSAKRPLASKVLASLGQNVLAARWDHPYPISAQQDEAELKMRKRGRN